MVSLFLEAIAFSDRLFSLSMEPPEMNTSQLLLVSSLGLGVNLFGMFAMGGHHHHVRPLLTHMTTMLIL